jgi:hypothetical protein
MNDEEDKEVATSWSSVLVTFVVSAVQCLVFYLFFLYQRNQEQQRQSYDLYEPRQHKLAHRSPLPYGGGGHNNSNSSGNNNTTDTVNATPATSAAAPVTPAATTAVTPAATTAATPATLPTPWYRAAWQVDQNETLRCVGLDAFMFLRFLRMGARMTLLGTISAYFLIPIYVTGNAKGIDTEQFNQLTLARIEQGSDRLWAPLVAWYIFVAFILYEVLQEWKLYTTNRNTFMAKGGMSIGSRMPKLYILCV